MFSRSIKSIAYASLLLLVVPATSFGRTIEEVVEVTATATNMYGKSFTRPVTVTVFRDSEKMRAPFMILNHGRPANPGDFVKLGRAKYSDNAKYFVSKGFVVFVPTRIGYGVTGGEDLEYSGSCSSRNYPPAFEAAAAQILKVIEYARAQPYVNADRGLVVGQSFGGASTIAVAAKKVDGVVAAVNFAGGSGGDPAGRPGNPCRPDQLETLYASYGETTRIPTLWLYSENDKYFGKTRPHEWFDAFVKKGGVGEFVQLPPSGEDGHSSFTRNPTAWQPAFEAFLQRNGF